ncbi:MAG: hypothetical protein WEB04_09085 [Dehalococcoidia bacterium]
MAVPACEAAMETLNVLFQSPLILNDGHEIFARLRAGDSIVDIAGDVGKDFGSPGMEGTIRGLTSAWPAEHMEAVGTIVEWALGKLDTDDRVAIKWKGDADSPDIVTRFELRDHTLQIEFAHPPGPVAVQ